MLPLFWNTSTRHQCAHYTTMLKTIGRFFVCNVLVIDRFHVKLKKMACGSKHAMQSLCNGLNTFYAAQHWAMKKSLYPTMAPQGSELSKRKELPKYESVTMALGQNHKPALLSSLEMHDLYKVYRLYTNVQTVP